jgi:hypothetical protein
MKCAAVAGVAVVVYALTLARAARMYSDLQVENALLRKQIAMLQGATA